MLKDIIREITNQYERRTSIDKVSRHYYSIDRESVDNISYLLETYRESFPTLAIDKVSDKVYQIDLSILIYQMLHMNMDALNILSYYEIVDHKVKKKKDMIKSYVSVEYRENFIRDWRNSDKPVVIRHKNCKDGLGVEIIAKDNRGDVEVLELQYGDYNLDEVLFACRDAVVLVGDFSFPKEDYLKLKSVTKNIVVLDHHETPYRDADSVMEGCIFDKSISGALLVWKFFNPTHFAPRLITHISDRDVWNWYFKDTKAVSYMLQDLEIACKRDNDNHLLMEVMDDGLLLDRVKGYDALIGYENNRVKSLSTKGKDYIIGDTTVYGINSQEFVSEMLNKMSEITETPTFAWWIQDRELDNKQIMVLSFRNFKDDIDLSELLAPFGGGGHKQAAGCAIELDKIDLEEFFINRNILLKD